MRTVRVGLLSIVSLLSFAGPSNGQATDVALPVQDSVKTKSTGYIASYWYNGVELIKSPVHWKEEEWAKFGAVAVLSGAVIAMDEPLSQPFFKWQTDFGKSFGDIGYTIGSIPFQLGISSLTLGVGAIAHNKPLQDFALDNLQAQIFTGGLTLLVKELTHRERPYVNTNAYAWYGPFSGKGNQSFFSGHSSLAFSTATMIFLHCQKKWWVGLLSYSVATGVAVSRMQKQAHWASDVLVGAVVGSAVSSFVYKRQQARRQTRSQLKTLP